MRLWREQGGRQVLSSGEFPSCIVYTWPALSVAPLTEAGDRGNTWVQAERAVLSLFCVLAHSLFLIHLTQSSQNSCQQAKTPAERTPLQVLQGGSTSSPVLSSLVTPLTCPATHSSLLDKHWGAGPLSPAPHHINTPKFGVRFSYFGLVSHSQLRLWDGLLKDTR